jgi:hypothetical protein
MIKTSFQDIKKSIQERKDRFKRLGIEQAYISYIDPRNGNLSSKSKACLSYEYGEFLLITSYNRKVLKLDDVIVHSILQQIKNGHYEVVSMGIYKNKGECE